MRAMAQRGIEGTHPVREDSSNHITHFARDFFVIRGNYSHETSPHRGLRIFGAITISIHLQNEENPIVSIGHSPTNKIFSAAALSLISIGNIIKNRLTQIVLHRHTSHLRFEGHDPQGKYHLFWLLKQRACDRIPSPGVYPDATW